MQVLTASLLAFTSAYPFNQNDYTNRLWGGGDMRALSVTTHLC